MFWNKSTVSNQVKLKESLVKDVKSSMYKLERGHYNKSLGETEVMGYVNDIRNACRRLENSIGGKDTDITPGCEKVKADLKELNEAANDNLIGRFGDSVASLVCDIDEIVDFEAGLIDEIYVSEDKESRKQRELTKKLQELSAIEQDFIKNRNRVDSELEKLDRDKAELDTKLLNESNLRLQQNIFRQIQANANKLSALRIRSEQYASCYNLLNSVKVFSGELIAAGSLSTIGLNKAALILNIDQLRTVLDDPAKLKPILKAIEMDLKRSESSIDVMEDQLGNAFNVEDDTYDAMTAYQNELIRKQHEKESISGEVLGLDELLTTEVENEER